MGWQYLTYRIAMQARSNKDAVGAASTDFLMYSGYVIMAMEWLKMEHAAQKALAAGDSGIDSEFLHAKIQASRFYFDGILPRTRSLKETMFCPVEALMDMPENRFAF